MLHNATEYFCVTDLVRFKICEEPPASLEPPALHDQ